MIEVEDQERVFGGLPVLPDTLTFQKIHEGAAVQKTGQRIGTRQHSEVLGRQVGAGL